MSIEQLSKKEVFDLARQIIDEKAACEDTLYVFSLYHSGDTMKLAAYAHHLKEFYDQTRIAFVSTQVNSPMWQMFDYIDEVVPLNEEEREILELSSQYHTHMYGENWIMGSSRNMLLSHFPGPGGIHGTDITKTFPNACEAYKSMILQIPYFYEAADVADSFRDPFDDALADEYARAILLAPNTYSIPSPEPECWEFLAFKLMDEGYEVYTNAFGEEPVIEGTKRFDFNMRDTFNLSRYFRAVISARSGLSDFLAFQPEMLHIVLNPEEQIMRFHDIACFGKSKKIMNINWNMEDPMPYPTLLEEIEETLRQDLY